MIDYDRLLALDIPDVEHTYTEKDTILYALGLGCGSDGPHTDDLKFVYERGLVALPMIWLAVSSFLPRRGSSEPQTA